MKIRRTTLVVLLIHLCVVLCAVFSSSLSSKKKSSKLIVHTVTPPKAMLTPERKTASPVAQASPPAPSKPAKPAPKKANQKPTKKLAPAKPVPAKAKKVESPPKAKEEPVVSEELLKELQESIAKIDQKRDKIAAEKNLEAPKSPKIDSFSFKKEESNESGNFQESLIAHLHEMLNLPEYGEVKIQLTLNPDGSVAKVVVLKSESEKNRGYLEKSLPHLQFPPLKGDQQTFTLTFCHEI